MPIIPLPRVIFQLKIKLKIKTKKIKKLKNQIVVDGHALQVHLHEPGVGGGHGVHPGRKVEAFDESSEEVTIAVRARTKGEVVKPLPLFSKKPPRVLGIWLWSLVANNIAVKMPLMLEPAETSK